MSNFSTLTDLTKTNNDTTQVVDNIGHNPTLEHYYEVENLDWAAHPGMTASKYTTKNVPVKNKKGVATSTKSVTNIRDGKFDQPVGRHAKPSIFNRYSLFFFNNELSSATSPESYLDSPNRVNNALQKLRWNPSTKNIIEWSKDPSRGTNAVEYAAEDFLWCKKLNQVPNNYMVTLRRFSQPCNDDLFDKTQVPVPDIARMITWVDGVDLKWENVGLSWSHKMTYIEQTSDMQAIDKRGSQASGSEANLFGGAGKVIGGLLDPAASKGALGNQNAADLDPYGDKNKIYGPIDVIMKQWVREKGLDFDQKFDLKFEYELRSINNINPKVAFIDLLSNILLMTSNKAKFWGGERRFYGGDLKKQSPFGDPSQLEKGDYGSYLKSLEEGFSERMSTMMGKNFTMPEGLENLAKSLLSNLGASLTGGLLDKMGRAQHQVINSLLTGDDTGEWHVMVGNPANPIISVGNLILDDTKVDIGGVLGPDDFPSKIIVTCTLKPARPRDKLDMMNMFSRNNRTYLTTLPKAVKNTHVSNKKTNGKDQIKQGLDSIRNSIESGEASKEFNDMKHRFNGFLEKVPQVAKNIG